MKALINQLPSGDQGRSMHSPCTNILMRHELARRQFNRVTKTNLNFLDYLHLFYYLSGKLTINNNDVLARLTMEIVNFNKADYYLKAGKYKNNKSVR